MGRRLMVSSNRWAARDALHRSDGLCAGTVTRGIAPVGVNPRGPTIEIAGRNDTPG
jgi:hypothetical protein